MATRQTRRQLQFTGFEMTMLAVSFVLTVTAVFFLGLFVGKKNASYHAPAEDRVARVPVDDFTKYKRPEPIAPAPKPVRPVEGEAVAAPVAASAAKAPAADAVKPTVAAAPVAAAAMPAASAPVAPTAAKDASAKPAVDPAAAVKDAAAKEAAAAKAKEATAAKDAAAKEAAKKKEKDKEADEPTTGRGYTVQLLATRKPGEADALVAKLKARGFAAYIKKVSEGEGAWYRVRVGSYGSFTDARGVADRCHRELGLGQAFVSTE